MRIGEIVRKGERAVPRWEPQRESPTRQPAPPKGNLEFLKHHNSQKHQEALPCKTSKSGERVSSQSEPM
jgi:hypothetical protein